MVDARRDAGCQGAGAAPDVEHAHCFAGHMAQQQPVAVRVVVPGEHRLMVALVWSSRSRMVGSGGRPQDGPVGHGGVVMSLPAGEPAAGPWRVAPLAELLGVLEQVAGTPTGRPIVVAVDGRGASGKSTLAEQLHRAVPASTVVHTDDVAWHHSFFD